MDRRALLEWMGLAVGLPALTGASPGRILAIGRSTHARIATREAPQRERAVLDPHQDATVAAIAEHIIPATDTPGARAARVNEFIDLLLAEWYEASERARFLRGLADVDQRSLNQTGTVFVQAAAAEQIAILSGLDAEASALQDAGLDADSHFFAMMKWLTLYGYYTSEIGQTAELESSIIPGRYDPCGPVQRDTPGGW